jgi:hypothetical protein
LGKSRNAYRILVGNPNVRDHLETVGVDESIILKLILKKEGLGMIEIKWLSIGPGGGIFAFHKRR